MTVHLHSAIIAAIKSAPSITIYSCSRSSMFRVNLQVPHRVTARCISCILCSGVQISPQLCGFGTHLDSRCRPCDRREGLLLNPRTVFQSVISEGIGAGKKSGQPHITTCLWGWPRIQNWAKWMIPERLEDHHHERPQLLAFCEGRSRRGLFVNYEFSNISSEHSFKLNVRYEWPPLNGRRRPRNLCSAGENKHKTTAKTVTPRCWGARGLVWTTHTRGSVVCGAQGGPWCSGIGNETYAAAAASVLRLNRKVHFKNEKNVSQ